jgi:hypothetical protein
MVRRPRLLQRATRRRTPVAFWHFGTTHLVVATLRASDDEPLLLSCAAVRSQWLGATGPGQALCPGFLELHRRGVNGAGLHVAALAAVAYGAAEDAIEVEEAGGPMCFSQAGIDHVVDLFRVARLSLVRLEGETSARSHLMRYFGPVDSKCTGERSLADDPLAAVSVTPTCESAAASLGALLAVPVGLALSSFGVCEEP